MKHPLPVEGDCLNELLVLLMSDASWQREDTFLCRNGKKIFNTRHQEKYFLPLLPSAEKSEIMLRWFWSPGLQIRSAYSDDLEDLCKLKEKIIRSSFDFFSQRDMQEALQRSASREYMLQEIQEHSFYVGIDRGRIAAVGGLKHIDQETAFIYSSYSKGKKGGAAIASYLIYRARKHGYKRIAANVYQENSYGSRLLEQLGFKKEEGVLESTYVSGHPIHRWLLQLS